MATEPDIPLGRVAAFVREHTHDVRNSLNSLALEAAMLEEFVTGEEGSASLQRMRRQLRALAEELHSLSTIFQDPRPLAAPIAARELLLIWQEKHAGLSAAPEVQWRDELGEEIVNADVEMIATVFRELLINAMAFSPGEKFTATARVLDGKVIFELREPKKVAPDQRLWGEPFSTTRRGGYGLGLWNARRFMEASGASLARHYLPEDGVLATQISVAVVEAQASDLGAPFRRR